MPPKVSTQTAAVPTSAEPEDKYAATAWGAQSYEELRVPSGQLCLIRRPGMQAMIKAGILNDLDSLTALVSTELLDDGKPANSVKPEAIRDILKDTKKAESMFHMLDKVLCFAVVKPEIVMTPNNRTSMKNGVIYAESVDLEDKMFILNFAMGGTRDVETFRKESTDVVASVDDGESVQVQGE